MMSIYNVPARSMLPTPTGDLDRLLNVMNIVYTMVGEKCFVMVFMSRMVQGLFTLRRKSKSKQ